MKINLPIVALLGGCLLPLAAYSADMSNKSAVPANVNETPGAPIKDNGRADPAHRSVHPVDDSLITTKVKAKFIKDKETRADQVEVETVDGKVNLTGTARSKAKAARHVSLARQVKGVKSVSNNIKIEAANTASAGDKDADRSRNARSGSDQPIKDTSITTKVKAKFVEDKTVSATNIHVKTINGVVRLTGSAKSRDEATKAAELARDVEGVKSVTNNIKVM